MKIFTFVIKKPFMYVDFFVSLPNYKPLILFARAILNMSKWTPPGPCPYCTAQIDIPR